MSDMILVIGGDDKAGIGKSPSIHVHRFNEESNFADMIKHDIEI